MFGKSRLNASVGKTTPVGGTSRKRGNTIKRSDIEAARKRPKRLGLLSLFLVLGR